MGSGWEVSNERRGRADLQLPPHTHTYTIKQRNEKQHSRMQGKRSNAENFGCEECKKSKKRLTPIKLENKKQE